MKFSKAMSCFSRFLLSFAAMAWLCCLDIAEADGQRMDAPKLAGFSSRMVRGEWPPVSIAFGKGNGEDGNSGEPSIAGMEWGREMLAELDRVASESIDGNGTAIDDVLSFRDWCIGAAGGGNLALAISAEEVAVELMFRELAEENADDQKVRESFDRCARHSMTADYWLASLRAEGIDAHGETADDKGVAEYLRLKAVFAIVSEKCAGPLAHSFFPIITQSRKECLDAFNPYALMLRTLMLEDKKVSLETCLAIQEATRTIPEEREEFRQAAQSCADDLLREENRLTSWTTASDVWNDWADALDAVRPGPHPRRSRH